VQLKPEEDHSQRVVYWLPKRSGAHRVQLGYCTVLLPPALKKPLGQAVQLGPPVPGLQPAQRAEAQAGLLDLRVDGEGHP
jgi:hypothetical protein